MQPSGTWVLYLGYNSVLYRTIQACRELDFENELCFHVQARIA
jgi:hypothetical protein